MKNKKMTYGLLVIAIFVWGFIFYKAIESVSASDTNQAYAKPMVAKFTMPKRTYMPDTFALIANYRDPFLDKPYDEAKIDTIKIKQTVTAIKLPPPMPKYIDWSIIRYLGQIQNTNSKQLVMLVNIKGRDHMMNEGDLIEGVKLIKNQKDSIKVSYEGNTKYIKIK